LFGSFVEDLRSIDPLRRGVEQMSRLLAAAADSSERLDPFVKGPASYTRTCLYADDRFEVLMLDWAAGATSAIHDHGGQHCWFVVLQGGLIVQNYDRVDDCATTGRAVLEWRSWENLASGALDVRNGPYDIHRVASNGERAVSLHVYAKPLNEFLVYEPSLSRCQTARGTYDRVLRPVDLGISP
jgi:cysteine dioxygenase